MSKRKTHEEPSVDSAEIVDEVPVVSLVEESCEQVIIEGWLIGEEPTVAEGKESIPTLDLELEREEGWEIEAFWTLLERVGYERW